MKCKKNDYVLIETANPNCGIEFHYGRFGDKKDVKSVYKNYHAILVPYYYWKYIELLQKYNPKTVEEGIKYIKMLDEYAIKYDIGNFSNTVEEFNGVKTFHADTFKILEYNRFTFMLGQKK